MSCSVLIVCGLILVQPETISSSSSIPFLPDDLSQPLLNIIFDTRGQANLIPVLFILTFVLVTFLISFLGCLGTCLRSRCMIFSVRYSYFLFFATIFFSSISS